MAGRTRVVIHIDMDCFFVQVERQNRPELKGHPLAVIQRWTSIAISYDARDLGVSRFMSYPEIQKQFPTVKLVWTPTVNTKITTKPYREASKQIFDVFRSHYPRLEKASIDEAFFDVTEDVCQDNPTQAMLDGASIALKLRQDVFNKLGYECSAGISHNKLLAKLASSSECKPNGQRVVAWGHIPPPHTLSHELLSWRVVEEEMTRRRAKDLPSAGGKLAERLAEHGIDKASELLPMSHAEIRQKFGDSGARLYRLCRGLDDSLVTPKGPPKTFGSMMSFPKQRRPEIDQDGRVTGATQPIWVQPATCLAPPPTVNPSSGSSSSSSSSNNSNNSSSGGSNNSSGGGGGVCGVGGCGCCRRLRQALRALSFDLCDRLEEDELEHRRAGRTAVLHYRLFDRTKGSVSVTIPQYVKLPPPTSHPQHAPPPSTSSLTAPPISSTVTADTVTADTVTADPVTAEPVTADPVTAEPVTAASSASPPTTTTAPPPSPLTTAAGASTSPATAATAVPASTTAAAAAADNRPYSSSIELRLGSACDSLTDSMLRSVAAAVGAPAHTRSSSGSGGGGGGAYGSGAPLPCHHLVHQA